MHILVIIGIVILIVWGIIKLIIWATPYILTGLGFVFVAGGVIGLLVGIFYGIKNYISSILENINNKALKIIMIIITCIFILMFLLVIPYPLSLIKENMAEKEIESYKNSGIQFAIQDNYYMAIKNFTEAIEETKSNRALVLYRKELIARLTGTEVIKEPDKTLATLYELRGRALIAELAGNATVQGNFSDIAVVRPDELTQQKLQILNQAITDFSNAIQLEPENAIYYRERGRAYNWKDKDDEAIDDFNNAIRLNPNYATVYNSLGILYAHKNDNGKAIENYSRAIQIDPNFIFAYRNRAGVYTKNNEYNKAIADLEAALRIDPDYEQAKQVLKQVQQAQRSRQKNKRTRVKAL